MTVRTNNILNDAPKSLIPSNFSALMEFDHQFLLDEEFYKQVSSSKSEEDTVKLILKADCQKKRNHGFSETGRLSWFLACSSLSSSEVNS